MTWFKAACAGFIIALASSCALVQGSLMCPQLVNVRNGVCAEDENSQACQEAKAAAASCPEPASTCAEPTAQQAPVCDGGDPAKWCGCWTCSARGAYAWTYAGDCEKPSEPPVEPVKGCVLFGPPRQALPVDYAPNPIYQEAVLAAIRRAHPSCLWGDCLIDGETQQTFQTKVEEEVRKGGVDPLTKKAYAPLCAGQHEKSTDEIAVSDGPKQPWAGYDVFTGDDSNVVPRPADKARRTIVWAKYKGTWYAPGTEPGAPPSPGSPVCDQQHVTDCWEPDASTLSGWGWRDCRKTGCSSGQTCAAGHADQYACSSASPACPAPRWETYRNPADSNSCTFVWGLKAGRKWWDATLNVQRCCKFCEAIGLGTINGTLRCQCPLRSEGQPQERGACEAEVGAVWQSDGTVEVNPKNINEAAAFNATWLRVCTNSGACSEKVKP